MTLLVKLQAMSILASAKEEDSENVHFSDSKHSSKKFTLFLQSAVLPINILVVALFSWRYSASFRIKNNSDLTTISPENADTTDFVTCFPDTENTWLRWPVFLLVEFLAVIDLASSLCYLKTLINSYFGSSYLKFLPYSKLHSPTYSLSIVLQSIWLQQVSLSCTNSSTLGNLFNLSSFGAFFQTLLILATAGSSIWLKIAESGLLGYFGKSSDEDLKFALKMGSPVLLIMNFIMSFFIWISNIKDMAYAPNWEKWAIAFIFLFWQFVRIVEYIVNAFAYEEEHEGEYLPDRRKNSEVFIEMTDFASDKSIRRPRPPMILPSFLAVGKLPMKNGKC